MSVCVKCGGAAPDCLCRQTLDRTVERVLEADRELTRTILDPFGSRGDFAEWDHGPASYPPPAPVRAPNPSPRPPHWKNILFWAFAAMLAIVLGIWASGIWR